MGTRTCLVVDDDPSVREYVKVILSRKSIEALQADGGVQGLRLAQELGEALDMIISDIEMPAGDGLTFVRAVRKSLPRIPIVLISGSTQLDGSQHPSERCECLPKPFSPSMLIEAIDRVTAELD